MTNDNLRKKFAITCMGTRADITLPNGFSC